MEIVVLAGVLYVFLKSHNEAEFEPCWKSALFIIHLRQELLCIFIDFDVFPHHKKIVIFALSRCV